MKIHKFSIQKIILLSIPIIFLIFFFTDCSKDETQNYTFDQNRSLAITSFPEGIPAYQLRLGQ